MGAANDEAAANDYNLSPSRYIRTGAETEYREIPELLAELTALEKESARVEMELKGVFAKLGYEW